MKALSRDKKQWRHIYKMSFALILFHSVGMLLLLATLLMFFFLVSAYIFLTLCEEKKQQDYRLLLAFVIWAGLALALWFSMKRSFKRKKTIEGIIIGTDEQEFDEGKGFYIYTNPGNIKTEINEKAFRKLKKGDRVVLRHLPMIDDVVSILKK